MIKSTNAILLIVGIIAISQINYGVLGSTLANTKEQNVLAHSNTKGKIHTVCNFCINFILSRVPYFYFIK